MIQPDSPDTTILHTTVDAVEVSTRFVHAMKLTLSLEFASSRVI